MSEPVFKQTNFSFYSEEAIAGRQAERFAGCLERIDDAVYRLSATGLKSEHAPDQVERIARAVECLRAELDFLADQPF